MRSASRGARRSSASPRWRCAPRTTRGSLHAERADEVETLPGRGAAAYLDQAAVLGAAERARCDAVHPGYGFLSENADFARACTERGITFVGPAPETLDLFGDKVRARAFADGCGVPVLSGTVVEGGLEAAREFLLSLGDDGGGVMIKAAGGGGGRGMSAVRNAVALERAWPRCREEARRAFGRDDLYVERLVERARHIEVQVAGDGTGAVVDFGERECSLQRRRQKVVEIAPAPNLDSDLRDRIVAAALALAREARFANLGTFEFLVDEAGGAYFIEANPRIQVEHTVTEELAGGRPRPAPARARGGRAAPRRTKRHLRPRLRGAGAGESRIPSAGRGGAPGGRRHRRVRAADRPRGARGHERLRGIRPAPGLRFPYRQGRGAD